MLKKIILNIRLVIQTLFFLYAIGLGVRFYFFVKSINAGNYSAVKPSGVEGFLPISGLMGLRQFLSTGIYDKIHPAGLTIFIAAIIMSIIFKKSFCGYICPIGFVSEQISKFGFGIKINKYIHYPLTAIKYLLLIFFVYVVFFSMNSSAVSHFINSPYNKITDAKMLAFILSPSVITVIVIVFLILLTIVFKNFWCRYICPYGALLGIFSFLSPFKVKRNVEACIHCGKCSKVCPQNIPVSNRKTVVSPECIGCMTCVNMRTKDKCLSNGFFTYRPIMYAVGCLCIFFIIFFIACFTGHWHSSVTNLEYGELLKNINQISH